LLVLFVGVSTADRLWLSPAGPSHTEITKTLPLFDPAREGLVRIRAGGMEFRARIAGFGNRQGEGVILLHGFPETSIMWEPLMNRLAKAGFRVVAFDQRGYSPGARPFGVSAYSPHKLAGDVMAVAAAVGFERFHVVGHDFGGAVAWMVADRFPRKVMTVTVLSMPHPAALADALNDFGPQWLNSSYVPLRWIPLVPELVFGFNHAAHLKAVQWRLHSPEDVKEYAQVFSEFGALRGALNWYRAFRLDPRDFSSKIKQPVLFMWGKRDEVFDRDAAEKTANYVSGPFRYYHPKAGHWLMAEMPDIVSNEIVSHLETWSSVSEQWKLAMEKSQATEASCVQSTPSCLSISVTPDGDGVRIRNLCNENRQGTVQISCTGWAPDAFVEYRFNLGPKTDLVQEYNGFSFGNCYYGHRLCMVELPQP
jgi:pimeloyl-ACP methyl ester carboxylesterase